MGDTFSAADLLLHGPYLWVPEATPDDPLIRDWIARCQARPVVARVRGAEAARLVQLVAA
jgi:glutathione S-transferase